MRRCSGTSCSSVVHRSCWGRGGASPSVHLRLHPEVTQDVMEGRRTLWKVLTLNWFDSDRKTFFSRRENENVEQKVRKENIGGCFCRLTWRKKITEMLLTLKKTNKKKHDWQMEKKKPALNRPTNPNKDAKAPVWGTRVTGEETTVTQMSQSADYLDQVCSKNQNRTRGPPGLEPD